MEVNESLLTIERINSYMESNLLEVLEDYIHLNHVTLTIETSSHIMHLHLNGGSIVNCHNPASKVSYHYIDTLIDSRKEKTLFQESVNTFDDGQVRRNILEGFPEYILPLSEAFEIKFNNDILTLDQSIRESYAKVYANRTLNDYYNFNYSFAEVEALIVEFESLLLDNLLTFEGPLNEEFVKDYPNNYLASTTIEEFAENNERNIIEVLGDYASLGFGDYQYGGDEENPEAGEVTYLIDEVELKKFMDSPYGELYAKFPNYENIIELIGELGELRVKIIPKYREYLEELENFENAKLELTINSIWNDDEGGETEEELDNSRLNVIFDDVRILEEKYSEQVIKLNKMLYALLYFIEDTVDINTLNITRDLNSYIKLLKNIEYMSLN